MVNKKGRPKGSSNKQTKQSNASNRYRPKLAPKVIFQQAFIYQVNNNNNNVNRESSSMPSHSSNVRYHSKEYPNENKFNNNCNGVVQTYKSSSVTSNYSATSNKVINRSVSNATYQHKVEKDLDQSEQNRHTTNHKPSDTRQPIIAASFQHLMSLYEENSADDPISFEYCKLIESNQLKKNQLLNKTGENGRVSQSPSGNGCPLVQGNFRPPLLLPKYLNIPLSHILESMYCRQKQSEMVSFAKTVSLYGTIVDFGVLPPYPIIVTYAFRIADINSINIEVVYNAISCIKVLIFHRFLEYKQTQQQKPHTGQNGHIIISISESDVLAALILSSKCIDGEMRRFTFETFLDRIAFLSHHEANIHKIQGSSSMLAGNHRNEHYNNPIQSALEEVTLDHGSRCLKILPNILSKNLSNPIRSTKPSLSSSPVPSTSIIGIKERYPPVISLDNPPRDILSCKMIKKITNEQTQVLENLGISLIEYEYLIANNQPVSISHVIAKEIALLRILEFDPYVISETCLPFLRPFIMIACNSLAACSADLQEKISSECQGIVSHMIRTEGFAASYRYYPQYVAAVIVYYALNKLYLNKNTVLQQSEQHQRHREQLDYALTRIKSCLVPTISSAKWDEISAYIDTAMNIDRITILNLFCYNRRKYFDMGSPMNIVNTEVRSPSSNVEANYHTSTASIKKQNGWKKFTAPAAPPSSHSPGRFPSFIPSSRQEVFDFSDKNYSSQVREEEWRDNYRSQYHYDNYTRVDGRQEYNNEPPWEQQRYDDDDPVAPWDHDDNSDTFPW